jgi:hypothetical protein
MTPNEAEFIYLVSGLLVAVSEEQRPGALRGIKLLLDQTEGDVIEAMWALPPAPAR